MKLFTNLKFIALFMLMATVPFVAGVYTERVNAQEQNNQAQQKQPQEKLKTENKSEPTFTYTAQLDDSFTLIARKSIQTFGLINNVKLSKAQIIYAETLLTQEANSPQLMQGQKVSIKESIVKKWVEKAQKLSKKEQVAWDIYAQNANFNTDNVGESR